MFTRREPSVVGGRGLPPRPYVANFRGWRRERLERETERESKSVFPVTRNDRLLGSPLGHRTRVLTSCSTRDRLKSDKDEKFSANDAVVRDEYVNGLTMAVVDFLGDCLTILHPYPDNYGWRWLKM